MKGNDNRFDNFPQFRGSEAHVKWGQKKENDMAIIVRSQEPKGAQTRTQQKTIDKLLLLGCFCYCQLNGNEETSPCQLPRDGKKIEDASL